MENRFYVYCHIKKTDGRCFYVGKGCGNRYKNKGGRSKYWWNIVNKHSFESVILVNNISEEKAFELETDFCNQIGYENLCNLNKQKGRGHSKSEETKQKLSVPRPNSGHKGPRPEETKQKMRKPKKPHKRSPMSELTKTKIGNSNKGPNENFRKSKFKSILQYDLEGNFIKEWDSIIEAKEKFKGDIQRCCAGLSKTSCGYIWKYKNN
jgi:hypothetical protein